MTFTERRLKQAQASVEKARAQLAHDIELVHSRKGVFNAYHVRSLISGIADLERAENELRVCEEFDADQRAASGE